MDDMSDVYDAFRKADASGNADDAKKLADYIRSRGNTGAPGMNNPSNMPARIYPKGSPESVAATPPSTPAGTDPTATPASAPAPYTPQFPDQVQQDVISRERGGDQKAIDAVVSQRRAEYYTPQQLEAAKAGVNIDARAPVSTFRANFAAVQAQRDSQVAAAIKQKFGPDTSVRSGPDAPGGGVQYFDKDSNQWKAAGDSFGGQVSAGIPDIAETIGGAAGAMTPATVVGGAVGAGVGRAAGVALRNYIGNKIGVNDGVDPRDLPNPFNEGLKSAGNTALGGVALSGVPAGFRLLTKGSDVLDSATANSVLRSYNENKGMVDQINEVTEPLRTLRGQGPLDLGTAKTAAIPNATTGRVNSAAANMASEQPLLMQYPGMAEREQTRRLNNENVLDLYWQTGIENPYKYSNITNSNWQADLRSAYQDYKDNVLGPFQERAEQAVTQAQQGAKGATPQQLDATTGGQIIRKTISDAAQKSAALKDQAWADYETHAKYSPDGGSSEFKMPITEDLLNTVSRFEKQSTNAMLPTQGAQASRYRLIMDEPKAGVDAESQTFDLSMVDRSIKDLREEARYANAGSYGAGMSDANRGLVLKRLVEARDKFLSQPDMVEQKAALDAAEAETVRHSQNFKRSFASDFLTTDAGGAPKVSDANVLNQIMENKDVAGAKQLAETINGEPGAKAAVMNYAYAYYNKMATKINAVTGERNLSPAGHTKFMEDVFPSLQPFLDPADQAGLQNLGGIATRVGQLAKMNKAVQQAWKATDSGQLGNRLKTETFVNQFFDGSKSFGDVNLNFIRQHLGEDAVNKTKAGIMSEMANRARDPRTGRIDVDRLSTLVQPIRARFERYFGTGTADNLDRFTAASRALKTQYDAIPAYNGSTLLSRTTRMLLGPLSAENRKLSFFQDMRAKSYAGRLEQALYHPKDLSDLVSQIEKERHTRAYGAVAAGVGADVTQH